MQNSSPSTAHCTQVPIKVQHRIAKRKPIRRRRVDLTCGCSYYFGIDCANHGFSHRGNYSLQLNARVACIPGRSKIPYISRYPSTTRDHSTTTTTSYRSKYNSSTTEESVGNTPVFSELPDLDSLTTSDLAFLKSI
ncbi:AC2 protein [Ageratum yellow vein virus - [G129]]|nr:AC2 protein [Ageratum yellow vein virus - [G129]]